MLRNSMLIVVTSLCLAGVCGPANARDGAAQAPAWTVLADKRLAEPVGAVVAEYVRLTGTRITVKCLPAAEVKAAVAKGGACDAVICMGDTKGAKAPWPSARAVAWSYPAALPVWAAAVTKRPEAAAFVRYAGGAQAHRIWAGASFRIAPGKNAAEVHHWIVENRIKHTYPLTAARMLNEIGPIRDGVCIDIGCGSGLLDIELAKRSNFKIIGLDIDPNVKPLFDKRIADAKMGKRISFVLGDAQKMPFADNSADVIISRGTLTFIPDIAKCLREVRRVLKPTGVAFLGGRYLYTIGKQKITTEKLRKAVAASGVPGATVIDSRGQWVKITGPRSPAAARRPSGGPHMLANRFIADYAITTGSCLIICRSDGGLEQGLQRGFIENTDLKLVALYPSQAEADKAAARIRAANLVDRVACAVGKITDLPFDAGRFGLVAAVGPVLLFEKDKVGAMGEVYRVLAPGGAALIGGRFLGMPKHRRVSSDVLRKIAASTGLPGIRISDDRGQWVEIRKGVAPAAKPVTMKVLSVKKIWSAAKHNAFTDLVRFGGKFYCAFREAGAHVSPDGKIRVLVSADGESWKSAAVLAKTGQDLRDAKITVMPDGRLMVLGGAAPRKARESVATGTFVSFSKDGAAWTAPKLVGDPKRWIWRVTWHRGVGYAVDYGSPAKTRLLTTLDGVTYRTVLAPMCDLGVPNEATLRFAPDDTAWCLQRRRGSALLGRAKPPYTKWAWRDLGRYIGGPDMIRLPNGTWLASGRLLKPRTHTALFTLDTDASAMGKPLALPSGGDTSYPGMVWHGGVLWVSYYASHEGKTSIYLARVKVTRGPG